MFEYTIRNHFRFGYETRPYLGNPFNMGLYEWDGKDHQGKPLVRSEAAANQIVWKARYGQVNKQGYQSDIRAMNEYAAHHISNTTKLIPTVLMSGGLDSEITALSFLATQKPFRVAIGQYQNGINQHDIDYALEWCNRHKVPYDLIEVDLDQFGETLLYDYAADSTCASPQLCVTMHVAHKVASKGGLPVLGSGECYLKKDMSDAGDEDYPPSRWMLHEKELIASWYRFFMHRNIPAIPGFFQYMPEQMLSFLEDERVQALVNNTVYGKLSTLTSKPRIYERHYQFEKRPKYTGFENYMDWDRYHRERLMQLYGAYTDVSFVDYDMLVMIMDKTEEK